MKAVRVPLAIGIAGLLGAILGWATDPQAFYGAWLAALILVAAWPLGCMALLLIHTLTGGKWGETLGPSLLLGVHGLPLLLPAILPVAVGLSEIYPWASPHAHPDNAFYLNAGFQALRCAIYLIVWFAIGAAILRGLAARIAAPALFVLAVTVSFAAIDSTMSLDSHFDSSIYGMLTCCSIVLFALSLSILLSAAAGPTADFGKLLLAIVILWIYLDFMQLLIVWQSDLAHESPWYLVRLQGGWGAIAVSVFILHFLLPFVLLLSGQMQRRRGIVMSVATLLIVGEILRAWWIVLPALDLSVGWLAIACMAGLGGIAASFAISASRRLQASAPRHV